MANIELLLAEAAAGSSTSSRSRSTSSTRATGRRLPDDRPVAAGVHPVSTGLVVAGLARPEWLVEVDAIAVIPRNGTVEA